MTSFKNCSRNSQWVKCKPFQNSDDISFYMIHHDSIWLYHTLYQWIRTDHALRACQVAEPQSTTSSCLFLLFKDLMHAGESSFYMLSWSILLQFQFSCSAWTLRCLECVPSLALPNPNPATTCNEVKTPPKQDSWLWPRDSGVIVTLRLYFFLPSTSWTFDVLLLSQGIQTFSALRRCL